MLRWGLLSTENSGAGGNPLDRALWAAAATAAERPALDATTRLAVLPFDHERQMVSVLVRDGAGAPILVTKGAPETVLERCVDVPTAARTALEQEFGAGNRVVAVATRAVPGATADALTAADERDLVLSGLLVFADPRSPTPPQPWPAWRTSASPSRSSPATTPRSRSGSAPIWDWAPEPTAPPPAC